LNETPRGQGDAVANAVTLSSLIAIFAFSFPMVLSSVVVNEIVDEFALTGTAEGLMSSLLSGGIMLATVFAPLLQGRVNKMALLVCAGLAQGAFMLAGAAAGTFALFCAACALTGFSGGFADAASNSAVVDVRKNDSQKHLGFLHGVYGIGSLLAPPAIYAMLQWTSWRAVYAVFAAAMALSAACVLWLTRGLNGKADPAAREHKFAWGDFGAYIRQKRSALLLLTGICATITQTGVLAWIVRYMALRYNAGAIGAISVSVYWAFATISRFIVPTFKQRPFTLLAAGGAGSFLCLCAGVFSGSAVFMCAALGALGLVGGHFFPVLYNESARGYEGRTTSAISFFMLICGLTRMAIPLVMAYASAYVSVSLCMLIPAVAALLSGWTSLLLLKEDKAKENAHA
jgi:MFS family permease